MIGLEKLWFIIINYVINKWNRIFQNGMQLLLLVEEYSEALSPYLLYFLSIFNYEFKEINDAVYYFYYIEFFEKKKT